MEQIFNDVNNSDVFEYWATLFPDFVNQQETLNHIEEMLHIKFNEKIDIDQFSHLYKNNKKILISNVINGKKQKELHNYFIKACPMIPSFYLFERIIYERIHPLLEMIDKCSLINDKANFTCNICLQLSALLEVQYARTLVLEINYLSEQGKLKGDTREQRYNDYLESYLKNEEYHKSFFSEYRSLYEMTEEIVHNFCFYTQEIIENVLLDYDLLNEKFLTEKKLGGIESIHLSEGDTHFGGKSVAMVNFSNKTIVYKPRNLDVDIRFQNFLKWLNSEWLFKNYQLSTVEFLNRESHGWMEFIEQKDCKSIEEAKNFYYKSGILLGILYCFNAGDFHYENIIANGENPILIDLETIFRPIVNQKVSLNKHSGFQTAREYLSQSVTDIGLLPTKMSLKVDDSIKGIELGGLGESLEQESILKSLVLENIGTDEIAFVYKYLPLEEKNNVPTLKRKKLQSKAFTEDIIEGFNLFYQFVLANKKRFIEYVIHEFNDSQVRVILKSTISYTSLLGIASHPDYMREPIHRMVLLSKIGANQYFTTDIKKYELSELLKNQVPYYYTKFESYDLSAHGNQKFKEIIGKSAKDTFINKVQNLSDFDKNNQISYIRNSFFERTPENDQTKLTFKTTEDFKVTPNEWIKLAEEIAIYILNRSFKGTDDDNFEDRAFIGAQTLETDIEDWSMGIDNLDLYDGNAGIALFLLTLGKLIKKQRYIDYGMQAIEPILYLVRRREEENFQTYIGAHKGLGGMIYTLYLFDKVVDNHQIEECIIGLLEILEENVKSDQNYDFLGGGIGSLAVLLLIHEETKNESLKEKTLKICNLIYINLESTLLKKENNQFVYIEENNIGSGFAHGLSGILPYLYKYYQITGNLKAKKNFEELLQYERLYFFDKSVQGWKTSKVRTELDISWCNGVVGIFLEKILLQSFGWQDEYIKKEIELAFKTMIEKSFGSSLSYCHGDLSALEIIRDYSLMKEDYVLEATCTNVYQQLFNRVKEDWDSEKRIINKYNGLMIGIGGLGYSLLKAYNKEIPSIIYF